MEEIRIVQLLQEDKTGALLAISTDGRLYEQVLVSDSGEFLIGDKTNRYQWKRRTLELHPYDVAADEASKKKQNEAANNIPF